MTLPTAPILVALHDAEGEPLTPVTVSAFLSRPEVDDGIVVPWEVRETTTAAGTCTLNLWPNARSTLPGSSHYKVVISQQGRDAQTLRIYVPSTDAAALEDLLLSDSYTPVPIVGPVRTFNGRTGDVALQYSDISQAWLDSIDPSAPAYGADYTGANPSTTELQRALDDAGSFHPVAAPSTPYGRGRSVRHPTGVVKTKGLTMSTWAAMCGTGAQASTVLALAAGGTTAALITTADDNGKKSNIGSRPLLQNLTLDGSAGTHGEHGVYQAPVGDDKEDAFTLEDVFVANFPGDGIHIDQGHSRIRARNIKSVSNAGWALWIYKSTDTKIDTFGAGRSVLGQMRVEDCASPIFSGVDTWCGDTFAGTETALLISNRQLVMENGQAEGIVRILGDNSNGQVTKFQDMAHTFHAVTFKVSPDLYKSPQFVGHTPPGPNVYRALLEISAGHGIRLSNCIFGYGQGAPDADQLAATPDHCIGFSVPDGGNYAQEAGSCEVTATSFRHMFNQPTSGTGGDPIGQVVVPFRKRISSDDYRIAWRGVQPGEVKELISTHTQINMVKLDPTNPTVLKCADYPELYLALDRTRTLDTAPSTFSIPACASTSAGWSKFVVAW